jgi:5-methyltetrahydrofolate--homocysteine methyltransferase
VSNKMSLEQSILAGDAKTAEMLAEEWLVSERTTREFCDTVLLPTMKSLRERFVRQEFFLPELLISLRAARRAMDVVDRVCGDKDQPLRQRVVVGALACDRHGLCRSMVVSLLGISGWQVTDLGANVCPARLAEACEETGASVLVIADLPIASGQISSTAPSREMAALARELEVRGIREKTRILLVSLAPDDVLKGPHRVDMICDDPADVPPSVRQLAERACA